MTLLLCGLTFGSDWPTARGPKEGTQLAPGRGDIDGDVGGYPIFAWTTAYSGTSYTESYSVVVDADEDGLPETIGTTQSRVYLWGGDGSVLAITESLATPYIHGLYDLDGDGRARELVVVGTGVGGGVFIYDAGTLALLWRSADPGLNGGGALSETLVTDTDGDGVAELLWSTSFAGYPDYRLLSFQFGFGAPIEVLFSLPTTATGFLPAVTGAYAGLPGGFLVEQGSALSWVEATDRLAEGAVCSTDETRCLRLVTQYVGIHDSATSGDRLSFDADGDGDDEYLTSALNDLGNIDIGVWDPSAGLTSTEALVWRIDYGNGGGVPLNRFVYASDGQGIASSAGGAIVFATVYGSGVDEVDNDGAAVDDCVDAADQDVVIAFDALTGTPLANLPEARARGSLDADGDGLPEILVDDEALGEVAGYELVCDGPGNTGAWNSCDDTGCALVEAWRVAGSLPLVLNQQIPADAYHAELDVTPPILDLDGDVGQEFLVREGGDLIAYDIGSDGVPSELGRHTLGACDTLGGWTGSGVDTWILLEGGGCQVVLDHVLSTVTDATLATHVQGVGLALVGDIGEAKPVVTIASRVYTDPASAGGMTVPVQTLSDTPVQFADLDANGRDELIAYRQFSNGSWRIVAYTWTGLTFSQLWSSDSTALGGTDRSINATFAPHQITTGDFDGDGDLDVSVFAQDFERGAVAFPQRGTLFFIDGGSGERIASYIAPEIGVSAGYAAPMQAADVCSATGCPGSDGVDELVFIGGSSFTVYNAATGYQFGWSIDAATEAMWGDFDADGAPEIGLGTGITSTTGYRVQVVELDGTQRWEAVPTSASGSPYAMHAAGDVDEDGGLDIVVGGGYGELDAFAGVDGSTLAGFPIYLDGGLAWTEAPSPARRTLQVALADVDGDDHVEALVAHDDGYLYAVNLAPADGGPSLAWSMYLGSPVYEVRTLDADGDGVLEVLVLANDGTARLIDGGNATVAITDPLDDACVDASELTLSGTAEDVEEVEVFLQGVSQGRVAVEDGAWTLNVPWPTEGTFLVEVWAVYEDSLITSDTISVTHYDDNDGDGVTECSSDCDDANAERYPGAEEICDGFDSDCDGTVSDESDDDGDGALACEECDDLDATAVPGGVEVCDGADNNCDGQVDEGDICSSGVYFRGGGGCGCGAGVDAGWLLAGLAGLVVVRRRVRAG